MEPTPLDAVFPAFRTKIAISIRTLHTYHLSFSSLLFLAVHVVRGAWSWWP